VCANFLVADTHLAVDQPDLFTANQVIHLQPLAGAEMIDRFRAANPFVARCYPNSATGRPQPPLVVAGGRAVVFVKRALETLLRVPSPLIERACRQLYARHLQHRAVSWRSPDQVRLQSDYLKLHTRSHRHAVMDRFHATVDTLMRMAKPRHDDLFAIFPELPGLRKRTPAEQMERVQRQVQDTRERASSSILRQRDAAERVRAVVAGRRRR
jgi:hypothetical protein